jgi:hypothetical protein
MKLIQGEVYNIGSIAVPVDESKVAFLTQFHFLLLYSAELLGNF